MSRLRTVIGRRGRSNSVRRPIRGLAVPSIPSIRTILNTIMDLGFIVESVWLRNVPSECA